MNMNSDFMFLTGGPSKRSEGSVAVRMMPQRAKDAAAAPLRYFYHQSICVNVVALNTGPGRCVADWLCLRRYLSLASAGKKVPRGGQCTKFSRSLLRSALHLSFLYREDKYYEVVDKAKAREAEARAAKERRKKVRILKLQH